MQQSQTWQDVPARCERASSTQTKSLVVSTLDQQRQHGRGWSSPRTHVTARGYINKGKVAILVE